MYYGKHTPCDKWYSIHQCIITGFRAHSPTGIVACGDKSFPAYVRFNTRPQKKRHNKTDSPLFHGALSIAGPVQILRTFVFHFYNWWPMPSKAGTPLAGFMSDFHCELFSSEAHEGVWRTVLALPTMFGRLTRCGCWSVAPAECEMICSSPALVDAAIKDAHRRLFETWLGYSLREQCEDVRNYLSVGPVESNILCEWRRTESFTLCIPQDVTSEQRLVFMCDMRAVTTLLSRQLGHTPCTLRARKSEEVWLDWRICQLQQWVNEHGGNVHLTLEAAAERLRTSVRHLGRLFRYQTGMPFRDYMLAVRMRKAAALVREPLAIADISEQLGYSEAANFSRDFKAFFGQSPRSYRLTALTLIAGADPTTNTLSPP